MLGVRSFGLGCFDAGVKTGSAIRYGFLLQVSNDDLVYPKLMAWEGAFGFVPTELDRRHVSPEFCTFTVRGNVVDLDYLRYVFMWSETWRRVAGSSSGTNVRRRRLYADDFLSRQIPLPDMAQQRRISGRLHRLYRTRQLIALSAKRARSVVAALHNVLTRNVSCSRVRVGDVLALQRRAVAVDTSQTYREIGTRSFGRGIFHKEPISGVALGNKRVFEIHPGDLIVSNVFAWEGAIAVAGSSEQGCIGSHRFMTFVADPQGADPRYVCYFFLSEFGMPLIQSASPGAAGRNRTLGINAFEELRIPLPDIGEQRRIASLLDRAYDVLSRIEAREKQLDAIIASALNQAFADLV
jgi:type I restriction enzyme S subunit